MRGGCIEIKVGFFYEQALWKSSLGMHGDALWMVTWVKYSVAPPLSSFDATDAERERERAARVTSHTHRVLIFVLKSHLSPPRKKVASRQQQI